MYGAVLCVNARDKGGKPLNKFFNIWTQSEQALLSMRDDGWRFIRKEVELQGFLQAKLLLLNHGVGVHNRAAAQVGLELIFLGERIDSMTLETVEELLSKPPFMVR